MNSSIYPGGPLRRDLVFEMSFAEQRQFGLELLRLRITQEVRFRCSNEVNMKPHELEVTSVAEVVAAYENAVKANGLAIMNGDTDAANAAYDFVWLCSKELKKRGPDTQRALLALLDNNDPQVRLCAAKDALEFAPDMGQQELEKLAKSNFIWALDAKLILREWKRGTRKFP
jgi:hypothetical protein